MDAASTLIVFWQTGTFEYELGLLRNVLYALGDIEAVIIFKLMLTFIAAIMLYYIALNVPRLDDLCKMLCLGASGRHIRGDVYLKGAQAGSTP